MMDKTLFDEQHAFMKSVFDFMKKHGITVRRMAFLARCSPATFYQLKKRQTAKELRGSTIAKIKNVMNGSLFGDFDA